MKGGEGGRDTKEGQYMSGAIREKGVLQRQAARPPTMGLIPIDGKHFAACTDLGGGDVILHVGLEFSKVKHRC